MSLKQYFKPKQKQRYKLECKSFIAYVIGALFGITILYRSLICSRLMGERSIDVLICLHVLVWIVALKLFQRNLNHPILARYAYVITALLYADVFLQGDKYIIVLTFVLWLYFLTDIEQGKYEEVLRELLGIAILVEMVSLYYLLTSQVESNGLWDDIILGAGIDIVLLALIVIWMVRDKLEPISIYLQSHKRYRKMLKFVVFMGMVGWSAWMIHDGQILYWANLLQENHRSAFILAVLISICALKPWSKKDCKTSLVRRWDTFPERICIVMGLVCVVIGYVTPGVVSEYAIKHGYTTCYSLEDVWNGNIILDGFNITDNGILVANRADSWIVLRRKPEYNKRINNISLRIDQFSGEKENATYFVFANENDWTEKFETGTFVSKKGKVLIEDKALHHIQNYIRLDLTEKKGTRIKLSEIRVNDYRESMGEVRYLGYALILLGIGMFVNKILREKSGLKKIGAEVDVDEYGGQHGKNEDK